MVFTFNGKVYIMRNKDRPLQNVSGWTKKALQSVMSFDCVYITVNTDNSVILELPQGLAFCSQPFCEGDLLSGFKA